MNNCIDFEYSEDKAFFADLLTLGDEKRLDAEFFECFDFRNPLIKRLEFNKIRDKLFPELFKKYNGKCQLQIHVDCSEDSNFEIDHIIPISTNELNKKIRKVVPEKPKKIPTQSFGSNHQKNLILACKRCNAFKKHRIILPIFMKS